MSSTLKLYGMDFSPMVRNVKLVLKLLDLKYEYVVIDLFAREQTTPEFAEKNPLKLVPVLEDNGHFICESPAICLYLIEKYAKNDKLYPKDLIHRAKVNECLFFSNSELFMNVRYIPLPILRKQTTVITKEKLANAKQAFELLETFLEGHDFLYGNDYTIADLLTANVVLIGREFIKVDKDNFPLINAWFDRLMEQVPEFNEVHASVNQQYMVALKSMITEIEN